MTTKEAFVLDLEKLLNGSLSNDDFRMKYYDGPNTVDLEGDSQGKIPDMTDSLGHFVCDADIRARDLEYKAMQEKELRKLIHLLKTDAPRKELERITFLGDSD